VRRGDQMSPVKLYFEHTGGKGNLTIEEKPLTAGKRLFTISELMMRKCDDVQTLETIRAVWEERRYLLDTHTAVAVKVYQNYEKETGDHTPTAIMSTASPFKFGSSVARALFSPEAIQGKDEFTLLNMLSTATGIQIPKGIAGLENREIRHKTRTKPEDMEQTVLNFLQL